MGGPLWKRRKRRLHLRLCRAARQEAAAASQDGSTLGRIHRTNTDWQRPVGGLAVMRAAPDLLSAMHWLILWVRFKRICFFSSAADETKSWFPRTEWLSWLESVYELTSTLYKRKKIFFFFFLHSKEAVGCQRAGWDSWLAVFMEEVNNVSFNISRLHRRAPQSDSFPRWAVRFWSELYVPVPTREAKLLKNNMMQ